MSFEFRIEEAQAEPKPMRALVVGGSGQIGGWLLRFLEARGHRAEGTYSTREFPGLVPFDASDREGVKALLRRLQPDVVFYPAGFTWVDGCERDRERAYAANLHEPLFVAEAAADGGARFIYFSTDYVFDGAAGPYAEDAPTNPLSVYGQAKCDAEAALAERLKDRGLIVRTSWVFGPERQGKNFAYQLVRGLGQGKTIPCPVDLVSNPSYGPDVARTVVELAERNASGLIHVVGPDVVDRVAFATAIAREFGQDESRIERRTNEELGLVAARPLKSGLRIDRLEAALPGRMRSLEDSLRDFRERLEDPALAGWVEPILPSR